MMATAKATRIAVSRRALIKGGLAVGAGLVVGFQLPLTGRHAAMAHRPISRPTSGSPSTATGG
jgi:TAT (twin-arginine translocation) pathway signal sequence.